MLNKMNEMTWVIGGLLALALAGCASEPQRSAPKKASAMVGVVNHTDHYIYSASVEGAGGGNMDEFGAGGASICCARIPAVWSPGMKVTVRWDMPIGTQHVVKEKVVEVEKYDEPGSIYIHVFDNDVIRVVVSTDPGYSRYHPIPAPVKPAGWKRKEGA